MRPGPLKNEYERNRRKRPEVAAAVAQRYRENKISLQQTMRVRHLRVNYGLSTTDYQLMLERQNGRCAFCGRLPGKQNLCVDHDHETGRVRGLLCRGCNGALGRLGDTSTALERIIRYLGGNN